MTRVIAVAGAGGPAGRAVVRRLAAGGAVVAAADADPSRLEGLEAEGSVVDLLDPDATRAWIDGVVAAHGRLDGLVHLVGGWRGGSRFLDNTVEDAAFLHDLLVRTLQHVTLAFHDDLLASPRSEFVIVSALGASKPTAGNAAYAASKAAAEAWTAALADSFTKLQKDSGPTAAASTLVVKALVHDAMREASPEKSFDGFTDVADLAAEIVSLWDLDAATANGLTKVLAP